MTAARPDPAEEVVFYTLPAWQLAKGMSTEDGQDVLDVDTRTDPTVVLYHVYTPRPDDPAQDEENRASPDGRLDPAGKRVRLAVFPDTEVDGSTLPKARILRTPPVRRRRRGGCS